VFHVCDAPTKGSEIFASATTGPAPLVNAGNDERENLVFSKVAYGINDSPLKLLDHCIADPSEMRRVFSPEL
jgi:hypothetical protein